MAKQPYEYHITKYCGSGIVQRKNIWGAAEGSEPMAW